MTQTGCHIMSLRPILGVNPVNAQPENFLSQIADLIWFVASSDFLNLRFGIYF